MDAFHSHSSAMSTSHKAAYRPGKAPPAMKRNASIMSLPSPPSDHEYEAQHGEDGMDVDDGVPEAPVRRPFAPTRGFDENDDDAEVDQLDSDTEVEDEPAASLVPAKRRACALGSPANLVGGGGASRRQLLNPFLQPAASSSTSSSSSSRHASSSSTAYTSPTRSDFPHSSPVRKRRAADPDRIRLAVTPPRKSRAELAEERRRQEQEEEKERKLKMMGWDDPENPFVERDEGAMAERLKEKKQMKRPETITLVKRGQRIKTSVPFTAVLTSTSTDDDPFTFTAPRLLFPPKKAASPPPHPSTPPQQSKFLEALRAAGAGAGAASEKKPANGAGGPAQLPPTPVTLKRKAPAAPALPPSQNGAAGARFGPYKKMRGLGGGHVEGGLR